MKQNHMITIGNKPGIPRPGHTRVGCRGIVIQEGNLLLSYESAKDLFFIPGGGWIEGETLEECCIREVEEETACLVKPVESIITVDSWFGDKIFRNHFFLCRLMGTGHQNLTPEEAANKLIPRWVPLTEALGIFGNYEAWQGDEGSREKALYYSYQRDYLVLQEVMKKT